MARAVQSWDPDEFLQLGDEDIVEYLVATYQVECLNLRVEDRYVLPVEDVKIDVSGDRGRYFSNTGPHHLQGTRVVVAVPFEGDPRLWDLAPNTFTTVIPQAQIKAQELRLIFDQVQSDAAQLRSQIDNELNRIVEYLRWSCSNIGEHNEQVVREAPQVVAARRQKLLSDRNLEVGLGIPVAKRDVPTAVSLPVRRKTAEVKRPIATGNFEPEPVLDEKTYEEAIEIILGMASMFERSPGTFSKLNEEEIRDHILVQLNGRFRGAAGGELFNGSGKTDILIRDGDRNLFIAECKFWSGPKRFLEAIEQLLGYIVWRDTKAAVVLFIKQRDATAVLNKADEAVRGHANFKRDRPSDDLERRRNYVLHQTGDENREIKVALLPVVIRPMNHEDIAEG